MTTHFPWKLGIIQHSLIRLHRSYLLHPGVVLLVRGVYEVVGLLVVGYVAHHPGSVNMCQVWGEMLSKAPGKCDDTCTILSTLVTGILHLKFWLTYAWTDLERGHLSILACSFMLSIWSLKVSLSMLLVLGSVRRSGDVSWLLFSPSRALARLYTMPLTDLTPHSQESFTVNCQIPTRSHWHWHQNITCTRQTYYPHPTPH